MPKSKTSQKNSQNKNPKRQNLQTKNRAPVALSFSQPQPKFEVMKPRKGGCAAYRGVDFVKTLASATSATNLQDQMIELGIGASTPLFPRLRAIAQAFRKYYFHRIRLILVGRSASTQKGNIGFATLMGSGEAGTITESIVKNTENCAVVRGWETGYHDVLTEAQQFNWYSVDTEDEVSQAIVGYTIYSTPATTAAGDLQWDLYAEYEVEFDLASATAVNALARSPLRVREPMDETIESLRRRLEDMTKRT